MDDFNTPGVFTRFGYPPAENNYIKPYKRAVSSMTPVILTDKVGNVKLVIGASGGPKIITAVAQVNNFYFFYFQIHKLCWHTCVRTDKNIFS